MDERNLYELKQLLQDISTALTSEHTPCIKPLRQDLDTICNTITTNSHQLSDNQQLIYNAVKESTAELTSQNELLRLQLGLVTTQNQLLIAYLKATLPHDALSGAIKAAEKATQEATAKLAPSSPSLASQFVV